MIQNKQNKLFFKTPTWTISINRTKTFLYRIVKRNVQLINLEEKFEIGTEKIFAAMNQIILKLSSKILINFSVFINISSTALVGT